MRNTFVNVFDQGTSRFLKLRTLCILAAIIGTFGCYSPAAHGADKLLSGNVPPVISTLTPLGRMPATTNLTLAISLPLRNQGGLTTLLEQIYDPCSTNYHKYLTSEQFTAQFGPTEQDYQSVIAFAARNGLTVKGTHNNRLLLDISGSAADIESAFQVQLNTYQHPTDNRTFYAPDREPSILSTLPILEISGINNYNTPRPNYTLTIGTAHPNLGSAPDGSGGYFGGDFRAAYAPGVSLSGSGQTVALVEFDGYYSIDIANYIKYAAAEGFQINTTFEPKLLGNFNGTPGANNVEVALDIEMAIAMAPNLSKVIVYEAPNSDVGFIDILNQIATDDTADPANQISCSWGGFTATQGTEQYFQEFEAQGRSFFNASGDSDAYIGTMNLYPSDSPNVTSVGGTTLTTSGPGGTRQSETVWNEGTPNPNGGDWGSSGGINSLFAIPTWQQGVSMSPNQGSTTMRNFPDVALTADNIFVFAANNRYGTVSGTSCAAPLWAGFTALVNQMAAQDGEAPVGFLNPSLYAVGIGSTYNFGFNDITTGNNEWSPSSLTAFSAIPGYDLCTGWGTPNGLNLIDSLQTGPHTFTTAGSLIVTFPTTAVLLNSGLVLVNEGVNPTSSELYNPNTKSWSQTGSLNTGREGCTTTLLQNGKVLVVGGDNGSVLNSAELYDPATRQWTLTGSLNTGRWGHTATLLPNGQVLVAGGVNGNVSKTAVVLTNAEIYDPNTTQWTYTGKMNTQRVYHTATLLPNGQVLVAGGTFYGDETLASAELYNPSTKLWTLTGSMSTARAFHTATELADGQVLVASGTGSGQLDRASAELYTPSTAQWTPAGSLNFARDGFAATLLPNGTVLVVGGEGNGAVNVGEIYSPANNSWTPTSPLNYPRVNNTATLLPNGQVLVTGGGKVSELFY